MKVNALLLSALLVSSGIAIWGILDPQGLGAISSKIVSIQFESRGWFIMLEASALLLTGSVVDVWFILQEQKALLALLQVLWTLLKVLRALLEALGTLLGALWALLKALWAPLGGALGTA